MDSTALATQLIDLLKTQKKTITTVESCTGGLIAGAITAISGSSEVFETGFVTYSNAAKTAMVGVPEALFPLHGAVSEEVAYAMAEGALKTASADIALSVTGIAGPTGGSAEKPVGMVCFGLSHGGETLTRTQQFGNIGRDAVREKSVAYTLQWAIDTLTSPLTIAVA